jgi:hypothetical protein
MAFVDEIRRLVGVAERLKGPIGNEANTKALLVEPTLSALGWDTTNLEHTVRDWPVDKDASIDYALRIDDANVLLIETRGASESLDDEQFTARTLEYVSTEGVAWCVLTNGLIYRIYKTDEPVAIDRRPLIEVDLGDVGASAGATEDLSLLTRESLIDGSLQRRGDEVYIDPRVQRALTQLVANPPAGFLDAVALELGAPEVAAGRLKESLARLSIVRSGAPPATPEAAPPPATPEAAPPPATPEAAPPPADTATPAIVWSTAFAPTAAPAPEVPPLEAPATASDSPSRPAPPSAASTSPPATAPTPQPRVTSQPPPLRAPATPAATPPPEGRPVTAPPAATPTPELQWTSPIAPASEREAAAPRSEPRLPALPGSGGVEARQTLREYLGDTPAAIAELFGELDEYARNLEATRLIRRERVEYLRGETPCFTIEADRERILLCLSLEPAAVQAWWWSPAEKRYMIDIRQRATGEMEYSVSQPDHLDNARQLIKLAYHESAAPHDGS